MKIVILDGHAANPGDLSWDKFAEFGELSVYDRIVSPELTAERMRGAEIVVSNKVPMDEALFEQCPELKFLAVLATGYNNFDIYSAARHGVTMCYVPAYSTASVAQHTMALLLEICMHTGEHSASVHAGDWANSPDYSYRISPLIELAGKTIGIIGFGDIGKKVAELAAAFGMKILYNSRTRYPKSESRHVRYAALDILLAESDIVSLHCPLTEDTHGLIGTAAISKMKDGAILLNVARGPVIDEAAVAAALESGKLYAAGVDVLSSEPPRHDNPLISAKNCIITPHIAWASRESRRRLLDVTYNNIRAWLDGRPQNIVKP